MFSTEPILWLQSTFGPRVVAFLWGVSQLGTARAYVALVVLLGFGLRLRPALGVLLALLMAGLLTDAAKAGFGMPRPSDVDARVAMAKVPAPPAVASQAGALGFWGLPARSAVLAARDQPEEAYGHDGKYGFPSGHVATAFAATAGVVWFFGGRRLLVLVFAWPVLMGVSRLTLGRHFLADVLAGLVVGVVALAVAIVVWRRDRDETVPTGSARLPGAFVLLAVVTFGLALASPFVEMIDPKQAGRLSALVVIGGLLLRRGFPADSLTWGDRLVRVAAAAFAYVLLENGMKLALAASGLTQSRWAILLAALVVTAGTLSAGIAAATHPSRLGRAAG